MQNLLDLLFDSVQLLAPVEYLAHRLLVNHVLLLSCDDETDRRLPFNHVFCKELCRVGGLLVSLVQNFLFTPLLDLFLVDVTQVDDFLLPEHFVLELAIVLRIETLSVVLGRWLDLCLSASILELSLEVVLGLAYWLVYLSEE